MPPIDEVFRFGSPEVQWWLASIGWGRDWGYNGNFPDRDIADGYERAYQDQLLLYSGGAHAVLGGWPMSWPDGNRDELLESRLIVWTFEDSEPWVEVWENQGRFRVIQRIT